MKKSIKKYILEALGVLLVIAACLTVHILSRKEALATEQKVKDMGTVELNNARNIESIKSVLNSDSYTKFRGKYNGKELDVKITWSYGNDFLNDYNQYNTTKTGIEILSSGITQNDEYSSAKITLKINQAKITYNDVADVEVNNAEDLETIKGKVASNVTVYVYNEKNESTSYENASVSWDGYPDTYTKGETTGSYTLTGTVKLNDKKLPNKVTCNLVIVQKTYLVTWTVNNLNPTIFYNDKSTVMDTTVSDYKGVITDESGNSYSFSAIADSNTIKVPVINADKYTLTINGCTLANGASYSTSTGNSSTKRIIENKLGFVLSELKIYTTASLIDTNSGLLTKGETGNDKEGFSVELSTSLEQKILSDQTDAAIISKINAAIADAKANNKTLKLVLSIDDSDVDDDDEEKMEDKAQKSKDNAKIGDSFSLSLKLMDSDDKEWCEISDTKDNSIKITYTLSSDLKTSSSSSSKSSDRKYRVYFVHDGSADDASEWQSASSSKISFKATKFSPYGVAYYDEGSSSSSSSSSNAGSNSASVKNTIDSTTSGNNASGRSPKTGDDFNPRIWIYLLIVAATIATCAGVLLQETKDDNSKNGNNGNNG